jgi:hypothetical protein
MDFSLYDDLIVRFAYARFKSADSKLSMNRPLGAAVRSKGVRSLWTRETEFVHQLAAFSPDGMKNQMQVAHSISAVHCVIDRHEMMSPSSHAADGSGYRGSWDNKAEHKCLRISSEPIRR